MLIFTTWFLQEEGLDPKEKSAKEVLKDGKEMERYCKDLSEEVKTKANIEEKSYDEPVDIILEETKTSCLH